MLKINNISKTFNIDTINENKVLNDLSLELNVGDFVTVIGANGAGKSTLLNMIAGVSSVDKGTISIGNNNINKLKEYQRAKYIGRVFQDPMMGTAANMEIIDNLIMANKRGLRRKLSLAVSKKEKVKLKEKVSVLGLGLENRLNDKVGLLSGGQRQAMTLLMATLKKPDLLLLDEHTAALDPSTAKIILEITDNIVKKDKLTTLMITHNMKDAINYGNRLVMMADGKIIYDVSGHEKQALSVDDLLSKFEEYNKNIDIPDAMILC